MESRKRPVNGYDNGRSARPKEDNGSHTTTDEEVEEFFAILRRMHTAGKQIRRSSGNGKGVEMTEKAVRWRPVFEWEDFVGPNAVKSDGEGKSTENRKTQEKSAVLGRLDLNVEPEPEQPADSGGNL
ncbi:hypothetical protein AAC387_Pa09g0676 [Persea americana]